MAKGKKFLQEIVEEEVDEIAEKVAEAEPELLVEEEVQQHKKMSKEEFLKSVGLGHRPGSHRAITAWEEYQAT